MSEFILERASPLCDDLMTSRISTSLCRVIFESPDVHDASSLMTVLKEDLTILEELGYPGALLPAFVSLRRLTCLLFANQSTGFSKKRLRKGYRHLLRRFYHKQLPGMLILRELQNPHADPNVTDPQASQMPYPGRLHRRAQVYHFHQSQGHQEIVSLR